MVLKNDAHNFLGDTKSMISDITPNTSKNNQSQLFKEGHSSISRMADLNTLQAHIHPRGSRSRKSKEHHYFEKKYRKSKDKIRSLLTDNANEITKNQALQKCNFVLGEKVEFLENK